MEVSWEQVTTRLPASDEAYRSGIEEPSITLPEALTYDSQPRSALACRVVAMHLLRECLDLTQSHHHHHSAALSDPAAKDSIFWRRFDQLDSSLLVAFATLPEALRCPCNAHDSNAVLVNLQLHTATIALYRAAVAVSHSYSPYSQQGPHQQDEASSRIVRIEAMIHPAAQVIVTTIALATDINTRFRNPFVAFAGFMAASVFLKEALSTGNEESVHKLTALLDVMVAVGKESPRSFPSTLAVQLAQELDRTGVDPTAMHKVPRINPSPRLPPVRHMTLRLTSCGTCRSDLWLTRWMYPHRCWEKRTAAQAWLYYAPLSNL